MSALVHLAVTVERDSEPIRGTVDDGLTTTPTEFTGWLELMSAFDTARAAHRGEPTEPRRTT